MPGSPTPIKRSPQLAPLSREHHDGLLFVWKIRQGVKHGIEAARICRFVHWFWRHYLAAHFEKEERLLPILLPAAHPLTKQMYSEHAEIKALLSNTVQSEDLNALEQLAQLVYDHIRFEERLLFAAIQKHASAESLDQLFLQLQDVENGAVWDDAFWIKTN